jgi:hypothetical protein
VDKFVKYKIVDDNGIIAIRDISQQPPHIPLVANNTDNDDHDNDEDEDDDDSSGEDDDNKLAAATNALEGN